jgi:hypothetical protein
MDKLPTLGWLESVAVLKLTVVLIEAYKARTFQFLCHSMDIHFILHHVEFEDGLSISVLENRAACHKNLQQEIKRSLKSQICSNAARPLYFTPP